MREAQQPEGSAFLKSLISVSRAVIRFSLYTFHFYFSLTFPFSSGCVSYLAIVSYRILYWVVILNFQEIRKEISFNLQASSYFFNRWIDCALGIASGVYHVSKFNSSVRTISSPDITRFSSSSISCTSENDFSGFGTCAQHGNIGSQAVRAEPALLEKRIFSRAL